jgi:hypothetical protein
VGDTNTGYVTSSVHMRGKLVLSFARGDFKLYEAKYLGLMPPDAQRKSNKLL